MERYGYGIDIGGTSVKLGFFAADGTLLEKWSIPTDVSDGGSHVAAAIAAAVRDHREKHKTAGAILGAGVGIPGPVSGDGLVSRCPNLGWRDYDAAGELARLLDMPVVCLNDANAAALGEMWHGGARAYRSFVLLTLGTGVGGAVIMDGRVVSGAHGAGGEIGHIPLVPEGRACGCGRRGCFERYASATGLVQTAQERLAADGAPSVLRDGELTAKAVWDAAVAGDAVAEAIADEHCRALARGCAAIAAVCDPEAFLLGGGVSGAGAALTERVRAHYREAVFPACRDTAFVLASLGSDAGIHGAFYRLLHR